MHVGPRVERALAAPVEGPVVGLVEALLNPLFERKNVSRIGHRVGEGTRTVRLAPNWIELKTKSAHGRS